MARRVTCTATAAAIVVAIAPWTSAGPKRMRAGVAQRSAEASQKCFGARARDPRHRCSNPRLRRSVSPDPADAQIEPSSPCVPLRGSRAPEVCAFGVRSRRSVATVALVGDSHAVHWRAALEVVARAKRWRGLSIYRSQCPLTMGLLSRGEPARSQCAAWNRQVQGWFAAHPSVHTVFVSARNSTGIVAAPGQSALAAKMAGFTAAWSALPASVTRVFVIRDPPHNRTTTLACIQRALAQRRRPGVTCALPRRSALQPDPAIDAAVRSRSPLLRAIDMTRFMCDRTRCYPVVGGVLVHKDVGHLTRAFSTTLGPYLRRAVNASWG
jgi:hypothetical protein